MKKFVHHLRFA